MLNSGDGFNTSGHFLLPNTKVFLFHRHSRVYCNNFCRFFCWLFHLSFKKNKKQSFPNALSQMLPLLPPPWELLGCASRMGRPRLPPFLCPASPSPSPPRPPPPSPRPGTPATGSTTTGPSTWPSATWDGAVGVIPGAPPTAATSARLTTSPPTGIP